MKHLILHQSLTTHYNERIIQFYWHLVHKHVPNLNIECKGFLMADKTKIFWTLVLEDHLIFIHDALACGEAELIMATASLYNNFDGSVQAMEAVLNLKKDILSRMLAREVDINLDATFLNHMINEAEAALQNPQHVLEKHKLWILDAEGHLLTIKKMIDPVEKALMKEIEKNQKEFHLLFCKTLEFIGYLRAADDFIALRKLMNDVEDSLELYLDILTMIEREISAGRLLGTIKPLMLDHMLREQSFYLHSLGHFAFNPLVVDPYKRGVRVPKSL